MSRAPTQVVARREFGRLLWRLADLVQAAERRRSFRAKAYRRAVWSLDDLDPSLDVSESALVATPGIGPGVAALLDEYRATGGIERLASLERVYPLEVGRLRRLPRVTPSMLQEMKAGLGIDTPEDLRAAIVTGAAETLRGVGPQTLELWQGILDLTPRPGAKPAHEAWVTASALASHIGAHVDCRVEVAGAVRRVEEWVDQIDLVAVTETRDRLDDFVATSAVLDQVEAGPEHLSGKALDGIAVVVHPAHLRSAGTVMLRATGPPEHAAQVTRDAFATEAEAYESAGLRYIPPPARTADLSIAVDLVQGDDLRGDLHLHTELSPDGRMSLTTIAETAMGRGYEYVLVTDHTEGLRFGGLGVEEIAAQSAAIADLRQQFPGLRILHGAELNVGVDGRLDLPEEGIDLLDFAVAGVHSHFQLDRATQTRRVLTALGHPAVKVLAHPFGRRIGIRPGLDIDIEQVIDAAVEHDVALEVNGHRDRLDLPAHWVRVASASGALFAADSDAHRLLEMGNVENAVAVLQRAGVPAPQVVNTWTAAAFLKWAG